MSVKVRSVDRDNIVREYLSGKTQEEIASAFHVSQGSVSSFIRAAGIPRRRNTPSGWVKPRRIDLPMDEIVARYSAGDNILPIANDYGVSRTVVTARLRELGIPIRGVAETARSLMARRTPEENRRNTAASHAAVRGRKVSIEERSKTAKTIERLQYNVGHWETRLAEMLVRLGTSTVPQKAVGPYNCDLAAYPVAVEVFGGDFHFFGRHFERLPKRIRYFLDAGWHLVMVVTYPRNPILEQTARDLAAKVQATRRDPSMRREYWVILGTGEFLAGGGPDDDEATIKRTLRDCPKMARKYKR